MTYRRFEKSTEIDLETIDNDLVLLNLRNLEIYVLNDTARVLWEAMDEIKTEPELVALLAEAKSQPVETVEPGIAAFLDTLLARGFLAAAA